MSTSYTIGIDYGTQSVRAVLVSTADGTIAARAEQKYPRGAIRCLPDGTPVPADYVLWDADDFISPLPALIGTLTKEIPASRIAGLGVDATSATLVPCKLDLTPLSSIPAFSCQPHAYVKFWKHHCVEAQAAKLEEAAKRRNEPFLPRFGGHFSCEWTPAKVLQVYEEDRLSFDTADLFLDLCDYITARLTGTVTRSRNSASFKGLWSPDKGDLSEDYLNDAAPGFGTACREKLRQGEIIPAGGKSGTLSDEAATWLGLPAGIAVSGGMMDGHAGVVGLGLSKPGDMAVIIGTSNAIPFLCDRYLEVPGLFGIADGGIVPGLTAYTAGQIATGDMLSWGVETLARPEDYADAEREGISLHTLFGRRAEADCPEKCPLTCLDWWNGSRCILSDPGLSGVIWGLRLDTKPHTVYCAMVQSIACGTRMIMDRLGEYGLGVGRVVCCGGIPMKNPFLMQQYAELLGREVYAATESDCSALGMAACAACAAGVYPNLTECMAHMSHHQYSLYSPTRDKAANYEALYTRYRKLYSLLGNARL